MTSDGERFAQAAAGFVGTSFRLHGRDRISGLDCVGLLIASLRAIGRTPTNPCGYRLRSHDFAPHLHHFALAGFREVAGRLRAGDVVQVAPGPGQLHFLITSLQGDFIHAHAGLGSVVRMPPPLCWDVDRTWRLQQD